MLVANFPKQIVIKKSEKLVYMELNILGNCTLEEERLGYWAWIPFKFLVVSVALTRHHMHSLV